VEEMIAALHEALERNEPAALATVVGVQGASPAQVGFKLVIQPGPSEDGTGGSVVDNVGGGKLEQRWKRPRPAPRACRRGWGSSH